MLGLECVSKNEGCAVSSELGCISRRFSAGLLAASQGKSTQKCSSRRRKCIFPNLETDSNSDMIHMLEKMVGKVFEKYKCDLFLYSGRSYGLVGLYANGTVSKLLNTLETQDYYGDVENVAMFTIQPAVDSDIKSPFIDGKMVEIPVMTVIQRILLIEEHQ